jgi:hypothetical protein
VRSFDPSSELALLFAVVASIRKAFVDAFELLAADPDDPIRRMDSLRFKEVRSRLMVIPCRQ